MTLTETPTAPSTTTLPPGRLFIGGRGGCLGRRPHGRDRARDRKKLTEVAKATTADVDAAVAAARAAFDSGGRDCPVANARASCSAPTRSCASAPRSSPTRRARTSASRSPSPGSSTSTTPLSCTSTTRASGTTSTARCARPPATRTSTSRRSRSASSRRSRRSTSRSSCRARRSPQRSSPATRSCTSPRATLSALLMAQILQEAGVPDGVFNVVIGSGDRRSPRRASGRRQGRLHRLDRDRRARGAARGQHPQAVHRRTRRQRRQHPLRGCGPEHGDAHRHRRLRLQLRAVLHGGTPPSSNVRSTTSCSASSPTRCRRCPSATSRIPRR